ncbi:unnamed protein product [Adineta steineri]|uniref:TATA-box-binding protein n=1 Tax=Adineta steineri TaxID=433720 RepID=A0A814EAD6_9BILA|nr:unnamed protein product [Adineta steineri]CAF1535642.1 unnamed protein product [Adineta steineri]CAF1535913.1 unnamed protein product [Adineta steineri]
MEFDNPLSNLNKEQESPMSLPPSLFSPSPWANPPVVSSKKRTPTLTINDVRSPQQTLYQQPRTPTTVAMTPMTPRITNVLDIKPSLQNIVATANLGCKLDLKRITSQARNAEYNPKRFAAVIMRIRNPRTTALIFQSGKMVCTGGKSENDASQAARRFARIIQKLGFEVKFSDFKIQNVVGSADLKFKIRLGVLQVAHTNFCRYEPEVFPGLIYQMKELKVALLIFASGKVVLTGAKTRESIYKAFEQIFPILCQFRHTGA